MLFDTNFLNILIFYWLLESAIFVINIVYHMCICMLLQMYENITRFTFFYFLSYEKRLLKKSYPKSYSNKPNTNYVLFCKDKICVNCIRVSSKFYIMYYIPKRVWIFCFVIEKRKTVHNGYVWPVTKIAFKI